MKSFYTYVSEAKADHYKTIESNDKTKAINAIATKLYDTVLKYHENTSISLDMRLNDSKKSINLKVSDYIKEGMAGHIVEMAIMHIINSSNKFVVKKLPKQNSYSNNKEYYSGDLNITDIETKDSYNFEVKAYKNKKIDLTASQVSSNLSNVGFITVHYTVDDTHIILDKIRTYSADELKIRVGTSVRATVYFE